MDTKQYFELNQELNKLLAEKPHLKPLQKKIKQTLDSAGSEHNRLTIINDLMMDSVKNLSNSLQLLLDTCKKLKNM